MVKYKHRLLAAIVFLLAAASVAYAEFTPPTKEIPQNASGTYTLDTSHANIFFSANHLGFSNYYGRFNKMEGTLTFDATAPHRSVIEMKVYTGSVDTNNSEMDAKLQDASFLQSQNFPLATFTSTKVTKQGDDKGIITGNLTLLGVTKPITLHVDFNGYAVNQYTRTPTLGFSARGKFKRSDFGMISYIPDVSDEVSLIIEAEFNKLQ